MLSVKDNEAIARVGKGTPVGELMRRYWHPISATAELDERPTKKVRLLGEDLVLYKDRSGTYGLLDALCPHRRVDLSYGIPEENGLRCMYHGWMFDETGQCIEQPFEETVHPDGRFKEKVKIAGYPVQELGGLLFAYMGPQPAPLLPRWEQLTWGNAVREICISELPCNWLQCQENSLDPLHNEWLHAYYTNVVRNGKHELPQQRGITLKIAFDQFEHGIIKRRVEEGYTEEDDDWKEGHPVLFPHILLVGDEVKSTLQFRVPIDDYTTYHVSYYVWGAAPGAVAPAQPVIPYRYVPLKDESGRYIVDILFNQDYMAWVTQGPLARRDLEKLGESDKGIIMYRKLLKEQAEIVADGGDPMNTFRDPEKNQSIALPLEHVKFLNRGRTGYNLVEAGDPLDVDLIEQTMATWDGQRSERATAGAVSST
ncbi:MAG: aromatic ring-hydroxylating dioxygenase subunit alpha [Chloroflexi bacterium]|nr:aromatic ring-hydroxylating dioxygenase subunit alpha [Chloroflexota bacterium]MDA1175122.1 aromatic ring-hydroxylating dioxygenase subunit alpha [Chloroflexota bacterium]